MENPPTTTSSNNHSRRCIRVLLWVSAVPFTSLILFFIHVVLIFKADDPNYSFDGISVHGFGSGGDIFTMNVTGRALNPNNDVDFYFLEGNWLTVSADGSDVGLCGGSFGASFLTAKETAGFQIVLMGPGLPRAVDDMLEEEMEVEKMIPLKFVWRLRVKNEGVAFKTWTISRRVDCRIVLNRLTGSVAILSQTCG